MNMTDYAAIQDLQHLLQRRGWHDLLGMVVTVLNSGIVPTTRSFDSGLDQPAGSKQLPGDQDVTHQLHQTLQALRLNDHSHVANRDLDKDFCSDLGQVIRLVESFAKSVGDTVPRNSVRDSGVSILGMGAQMNGSLDSGLQNNSIRFDNQNAPGLEYNVLNTTPNLAYTAPSSFPPNGQPSMQMSAVPNLQYPRAQFGPTSPNRFPILLQQQQLPSGHFATNRPCSEPSQASSLERYRSPPTAYGDSSSRSNASTPHHLVASTIPNAIGPSIHTTLHSTFKLRSSKFFKVGRVFMVLWTEPEGNDRYSASSKNSMYSFPVAYGEWTRAKIRRFVVIAQLAQHSLAIPISTYQNRGVANKGVNKADHGIVHIGPMVPEPRDEELPQRGETGMVPTAIRIIADDPTEKLAPTSRINYGKIYTIEHNIKAKGVGMVHESSMRPLLQQQNEVLTRANAPVVKETQTQ